MDSGGGGYVCILDGAFRFESQYKVAFLCAVCTLPHVSPALSGGGCRSDIFFSSKSSYLKRFVTLLCSRIISGRQTTESISVGPKMAVVRPFGGGTDRETRSNEKNKCLVVCGCSEDLVVVLVPSLPIFGGSLDRSFEENLPGANVTVEIMVRFLSAFEAFLARLE